MVILNDRNCPQAKRKRKVEREKRKAAFWGEGYVNDYGLFQKWESAKVNNYERRRFKERQESENG